MANLFPDIIKRLEEVKKYLPLNEGEFDLLITPKKINHTEIKLKGKKYPAWRIVHNTAIGPGKGGIRFHQNVDLDEVKSLAFWMSLKTALADIPYGGAKGGVCFDPKQASPKEIENISRAYIDEFYGELGQDKDIPAPDMNTNPQIMSWMLDQYEKNVGHKEPGMITGKPIELGGCPLRSDSTSRGGQIIIDELLHHFDLDKEKVSIAIQGFGNVGLNTAKLLDKDGIKVVAVSDTRGGIYNRNGIDVKEAINIKSDGKNVQQTKGNSSITNEELLELDVDILVLAAMENQITIQNAKKIKAKFIVELANGPITPQADTILLKNNKVIIPDILANSGGVIVSYFEWAQNKSGNLFDDEYLLKKLITLMQDAWHRVYDLKNNKKITDLRICAYIIAIQKILKAEKLRGNIK